jgi:hypothetical protein
MNIYLKRLGNFPSDTFICSSEKGYLTYIIIIAQIAPEFCFFCFERPFSPKNREISLKIGILIAVKIGEQRDVKCAEKTDSDDSYRI